MTLQFSKVGYFKLFTHSLRLSGKWKLTVPCTTENRDAMVSDLMRKVKQIEYIIASLPVTTPSSDVDRLSTLNTESAAADAELMEVSRGAGKLLFPSR